MLNGASQEVQSERIRLPVQETQETWVQSLGWEDPLGEEMVTPAIFLPGESHGKKSLVGSSPWSCK